MHAVPLVRPSMKFNEILPRSPHWLHGESMVADFQQGGKPLSEKMWIPPVNGIDDDGEECDKVSDFKCLNTNSCTTPLYHSDSLPPTGQPENSLVADTPIDQKAIAFMRIGSSLTLNCIR
jgi:hypothetical protein